MTRQQILEEARRLSREDQIDLAMALWDAQAAEAIPVTPELAAELDRRIAEDDACDEPGQPAAVVAAKIRRGEY